MPRSRSSEMPQRQSPRGPHPLRTSSSDSDPLHHRPITDRSPKLGDRRSPRGPQSDPAHQKKLGTRIADLESQLGQAQDELKNLKDQLVSAEAAKKQAQLELESKTKKPARQETVEINDKRPPPTEVQHLSEASVVDKQHETQVLEVQLEKGTVPAKVEPEPEPEPIVQIDEAEKENGDPMVIITEPQAALEPEKTSDDEKNLLRAKLEEKEKELDAVGQENKNLKDELNQATMHIVSAKAKEEEMALRLSQLGREVEESRANAANLKERLEAAERAKEASEDEIKKMRVQTEQWRKAADAAAAVLAGDVEMNGRISERCGSMDKNFGGVFEASGFVGSPGMGDELDDSFGSAKRKGSGIKMFGDLWRKRGQK